MEDGKIAAVKDDCTVSASLASLYAEFPPKFGANGHDFLNDGTSLPDQYRQHADSTTDNQFKKRINPLKIHLGKRPFVDNSPPNNIPAKKKAPFIRRPSESSNLSHSNTSRPSKTISKKRNESNQYQNITSQWKMLEDEKDKPVPRLVPKSQLSQFKKSAIEKSSQMKEAVPSIPPTVKFKCRKCYSMSFNTLAMLKEHQLVCRAQTKEPAKTATNADSASGPSRITRKVYLCSACGTYYENWNLFLHMREVHNRHICLFCLGMFSKAEKLSTHLTNKHNVQECKYDTKEDFLNVYNGTLYLMCCECDEICSEKDDFFNHDCNNVKPKPVPVLVSKNASKLNNVKQTKNTEMIMNGPANIVKDKKLTCDIPKVDIRKELNDTTLETMQFSSMVSQYNSLPTNESAAHNFPSNLPKETIPTSATYYSEQNEQYHSGSESISESSKMANISLPIPNGNQTTDLLNREYHLDATPSNSPVLRQPLIKFKELPPKPTPEKEGGIKLKLSLNSARSPVIINSTVDPTIGKNPHKPPTRVRRPPKRYDKCSAARRNSQSETEVPRTPSIKMTICNKADKPFVNTTFYDNNQQTILKTLLNNNVDSSSEKSPEHKQENVIKSTIYDNILEDTNTLNRVPKLTVRVPKELLDRDSSSEYSSGSDTNDRLTMDEEITHPQTPVTLSEPIVDLPKPEQNMEEEPKQLETDIPSSDLAMDSRPTLDITEPTYHEASSQSDQEEIDVVSSADNKKPHNEPQVDESSLLDNILPEISEEPSTTIISESNTNQELSNQVVEPMDSETKESNIDSIAESNSNDINVEDIPTEPAIEELPVIELNLDRPIDIYPLKELLKVFLSNTMYNCVYCNHVRKIAVNCEQLSLHMALEHRFRATVDSITAEELMPETISAKVQATAEELRTVYINLDSYDSVDKYDDVKFDHLFECFQCYFKTAVHKDLYLHNRKMHQKTILLCVMCKTNFYSYSELLCHLCPGTNDSEYDIKFRCCLCNVDSIPSSFRLMVHLRKVHNACDVCLEFCHNQGRLSSHVWKHKLHHVCYRCGIAYRNKPDITRHLFWKHGTESVLCKRCLQKKWPHVYHFCTPPAVFICDECSMHFTKAVCLKVHKRFHSEEYPHMCTEEGCTEKFVSKKLLMKHLEEKQRKLATVAIDEKLDKIKSEDTAKEASTQDIPTIDLVDDDKPKEEPNESAQNNESTSEQTSKKGKKKKNKEKDALLLDVNLPELNLSESDSSDESDSGMPETKPEDNPSKPEDDKTVTEPAIESVVKEDVELLLTKTTDLTDEKSPVKEEEQPDEQKVLDIWDNFKKYQATTEPLKEKTPPRVPIRKHVCESDHDYCIVPVETIEDDPYSLDKKKKKKSRKLSGMSSSSSSSSSSDSGSSCSCVSNCSCSSSSGSSSSSSSDSDSSGDLNHVKRKKRVKTLSGRRASNGSNVDVMGVADTPLLVPDKIEPQVAETDLETDESDTDEEFYDEHPQKLANKLHAEKKNQLLLLATVAPSDGGSVSGEASRPVTPIKEEEVNKKEKSASSKKKSKKKKKKSSRKHAPIKINIPKDIIPETSYNIPQTSYNTPPPLAAPNKITISLQSNTVQVPPQPVAVSTPKSTGPNTSNDNKRSSKRRRVPNKFYGYSSDEEAPQATPLKPHLPPKLEWRKEDLPSPVTHKPKKETPITLPPQSSYNYIEPFRLKAPPLPDPEPPKIIMNTESMESSDSDSSDSESGGLQIYQPPVPPPMYLTTGTSSLPYQFQRPAGRQAREGESVYCYCRCPYDEVSEMIACDAEGCSIEWFHFECVGIMVPPKGKWYCPECRKKLQFSGFR